MALCSSRCWSWVAEDSRPWVALGRGAVGCSLHGSCGRAGMLQQESMELGANLLLCALQGCRVLVKAPLGPPCLLREKGMTCPSLGPGVCCQGTLLYCMAQQQGYPCSFLL